MFRTCTSSVLVSVLALLASAQSGGSLFTKAPPDVDKALRDRMNEYYALFQAAKYRASEAYVCEDSKDAYYAMNKREFEKLEIVAVRYEEGFQKAEVSAKAEALVQTPKISIKAAIPVNSLWRVENGTWCRYLEPPGKGVTTPFGVSYPGVGGPGTENPGNFKMPTLEDILKKVHLSKNKAVLHSVDKSSDEIEIFNEMPGPITLELSAPPREGLSVSLSALTLEAGRTGALRLSYAPPDKSPKPLYRFVLKVEPTGQRFELMLPPGLAKQP
jgi:hypothetical protein